jgi:hypothetical protein
MAIYDPTQGITIWQLNWTKLIDLARRILLAENTTSAQVSVCIKEYLSLCHSSGSVNPRLASRCASLIRHVLYQLMARHSMYTYLPRQSNTSHPSSQAEIRALQRASAQDVEDATLLSYDAAPASAAADQRSPEPSERRMMSERCLQMLSDEGTAPQDMAAWPEADVVAALTSEPWLAQQHTRNTRTRILVTAARAKRFRVVECALAKGYLSTPLTNLQVNGFGTVAFFEAVARSGAYSPGSPELVVAIQSAAADGLEEVVAWLWDWGVLDACTEDDRRLTVYPVIRGCSTATHRRFKEAFVKEWMAPKHNQHNNEDVGDYEWEQTVPREVRYARACLAPLRSLADDMFLLRRHDFTAQACMAGDMAYVSHLIRLCGDREAEAAVRTLITLATSHHCPTDEECTVILDTLVPLFAGVSPVEVASDAAARARALDAFEAGCDFQSRGSVGAVLQCLQCTADRGLYKLSVFFLSLVSSTARESFSTHYGEWRLVVESLTRFGLGFHGDDGQGLEVDDELYTQLPPLFPPETMARADDGTCGVCRVRAHGDNCAGLCLGVRNRLDVRSAVLLADVFIALGHPLALDAGRQAEVIEPLAAYAAADAAVGAVADAVTPRFSRRVLDGLLLNAAYATMPHTISVLLRAGADAGAEPSPVTAILRSGYSRLFNVSLPPDMRGACRPIACLRLLRRALTMPQWHAVITRPVPHYKDRPAEAENFFYPHLRVRPPLLRFILEGPEPVDIFPPHAESPFKRFRGAVSRLWGRLTGAPQLDAEEIPPQLEPNPERFRTLMLPTDSDQMSAPPHAETLAIIAAEARRRLQADPGNAVVQRAYVAVLDSSINQWWTFKRDEILNPSFAHAYAGSRTGGDRADQLAAALLREGASSRVKASPPLPDPQLQLFLQAARESEAARVAADWWR